MRRYRRAKIVATVGPASSLARNAEKAVLAGVDTFRLNFSHGTHDDHAKSPRAIRALEREVGRPIGILQDLQGPKIRVGTIRGREDRGRGRRNRSDFVLEGSDGDRNPSHCPIPRSSPRVMPGHDLLIDDGRVRVRVTEPWRERSKPASSSAA